MSTSEMGRMRSDRRCGTRVVRLGGEIDVSNARSLGAAVLAEAADESAAVLDLTDVTFLDSAGALALVRLSGELCRRRIAHCFVAPAERRCLRAAELLGLAPALPLAPSEEEALRRVARAPGSPSRSSRSSDRRMAAAEASRDANRRENVRR